MKSRVGYLFLVGIVILLGIGSRIDSDMIPPFIAQHAGDILWASMVYFWVRFFWIKKTLLWAVGISVMFSFGIEFSQLYQSVWINEIRNTTIGSLILGRGFLWIDLLRYVIGILLAYLFDQFVFWKVQRSHISKKL